MIRHTPIAFSVGRQIPLGASPPRNYISANEVHPGDGRMLVPIPCARHVGRLTGVVLLCLFAVAAPRAQAAFHLWQAKEIFTNSTGSVQFIELHDNFGGENSVTGFTLTSNSDGVIKTFMFPHDLVG